MDKCIKCGAPIYADEPLPEPQLCLDCIMDDDDDLFERELRRLVDDWLLKFGGHPDNMRNTLLKEADRLHGRSVPRHGSGPDNQ